MTDDSPQQPRTRNRATLVLIAAVFVAPIVLAWLFASGVLDIGGRARTNHGHLVTPPIDIRALPAKADAALLSKLRPADWAVLYVTPGVCDAACEQQLQALEVVRSLSGTEATRVSVFGLAAQAAADPGPSVRKEGARVLVDPEFVAALQAELAQRPPGPVLPFRAFIDWRGQLMMTFPAEAPPADIKNDLGRLLRASAIR